MCLQIMVKYESQTKTSIVSSEYLQTLCKSIVRGKSVDKLAKVVYQSPMKAHLHHLMLAQLSCDSQGLCRRKEPSILRAVSPDSLLNINWTKIISEWKQRSKLLYEVLEAIAVNKKGKKRARSHSEKSYPVIAVAGASLLFNRTPQMSCVHHTIGQILDHGGATNEVCLYKKND